MRHPTVPRQALASLLAVGVTLLTTEGCTSFSVEGTSPARGSAPRAASLRFSAYENRDAMKKAEAFGGSIRSRLLRLEPPPEEAVFESTEASWTVPELTPGKYRLEVSRRAGPEPAAAEIWHGVENIKVKAGEEVSAFVILKDSRAWAWAGTGLGIAAVAVLGVLVLVGIFSFGTRGITPDVEIAEPPAGTLRPSPPPQRPSTPSNPRVP